MPAIEAQGFRLIVNTRDERGHKPHVHVVYAGSKCKIILNAELTPYDVRMPKNAVRRARELVAEHFGELLALWERCNG